MKEADIELILQIAKEKHPEARPLIISDNGPQYVSKDLKEFVRLSGMTHVITSPYYPQSNGKIESWHKSLKKESIRPACPETFEEAEQLITEYVRHYNEERLHSGIGYITPADKLAGRAQEIHARRDSRLEKAREKKAAAREMLRAKSQRSGASIDTSFDAGPTMFTKKLRKAPGFIRGDIRSESEIGIGRPLRAVPPTPPGIRGSNTSTSAGYKNTEVYTAIYDLF